MTHRIFFICILAMAVLAMAGTIAHARDDIDEHRECIHCGMDRKAYGYSRMLLLYEDGGQAGVCSLHCAVVECDAGKGRKVKTFLVADRDTRNLTDAGKAIWVIGGKKRGVMTQRAKWAFATTGAAQAFINKYGGKIVSWDEALAAAREDAVPKPR